MGSKNRRHKKREARRPASGQAQAIAPKPMPIRGSVDAIVTAHVTTDRLEAVVVALRRELPPSATITLADALIPRDDEATIRTEMARIARENGARVDPSGSGLWDARNKAASHGYAPLLLFMDGDAVITRGSWAMIEAALESDDVGVVGGLILYDVGLAPPSLRGGGKTPIKAAGYAIGGPRFLPYARFSGGWSPDNPKIYYRDDLQAVNVPCMATRRVLFRTLNGFQAGTYGDRPYAEVEYCLQARQRGLRIVFEPRAIAVAGKEPQAMSIQQLQEGAAVYQMQAMQLAQYDELFVL